MRALALAKAFREEGLDPLRPYRRLDARDDDELLAPLALPVSIPIAVNSFELHDAAQDSRTDPVEHRRGGSHWRVALPLGVLGPATRDLQLDGSLNWRDCGVWGAHYADNGRLRS